MALEACSNSVAGSQDVSSLVPSYLVHCTKYRSLQMWRLSILESSTLEILCSKSLSISTGGGRGTIQFGIVFRVMGSSMEMWKMGWTACMASGSQSTKECEPAFPMISKGPRNFSASFWEGLVILCFNIDLGSDLELRCWSLTGVCRTLIASLCISDLGMEFLVEFVQVHSKFSGMNRSHFVFQVHQYIQMITLVRKEWGNPCSGTRSIVV